MPEFEAGLDVRSVASGHIATVRHGDGTSTDYWGPTADAARERALRGED